MAHHLEKFPAWVLIRPAGDVANQWVAHCLQYDVVTQGTSPAHALDMIFEAVAIVLIEDLREGCRATITSPHRRQLDLPI
jgi:hypothetical protein